MKQHKYIFLLAIILVGYSCKKTLDQSPKGTLNIENLNDRAGAEALVVSAYALLDQVRSDAGAPAGAAGSSCWP